MASAEKISPRDGLDEKTTETPQEIPPEQDLFVRQPEPRSIKTTALRLLFDLFCLSWIAPIVILLYLNFTGWTIGSGVACRLPSYKSDCKLWQDVPLRLAELDDKDHEILGSLQIVAKALEVWFTVVAGSLMLDLAILLAVSKIGLPMGHFLTYLEFASITVLFKPTFWISSKGEDRESPWYRPPKVWLWAFLVLAVLLCAACNLMGPATAVLAIPTLNWSEHKLPTETALSGLPSNEPPTQIGGIPSSVCPPSELQAGSYTCTDIFSSSVDELSAALWARSEWRRSGFFTMSPMIPFRSLTFTINETDAIDGFEIDWMPSRSVLTRLDEEYSKLWVSRATPNFTSASDMLGDWPLDPGLYYHYTNSLDVEMSSYGPILGVRSICSTAANITEFDIAPRKRVRCYTRTSTTSPNTFRYHCIRMTSAVSDWTDVGHYSHANFTLKDRLGVDTHINVHSADKAFQIPKRYSPCLWDHERSDCDWNRLLDPKSDTDRIQTSVHYTEYFAPDAPSAEYTVMCYTEFYHTMADYIAQIAPTKINTTIVNTENRLEAKHINVHADWALAAWSAARGETFNATRSADKNLLDALGPLMRTPPPKTEAENDAFETRWFYDQHKVMSLQTVSLIGHTTTNNKTLVDAAAASSPSSDPYRPQLTNTQRFRVWSYSTSSQTFRMGATVCIFGCLCVIARTFISLVYRLPQPSTLAVLAAALRFEYKGDLDGLSRETHIARIPYGYARHEAAEGGIGRGTGTEGEKKVVMRERIRNPPMLVARRQ
ncbi:hypothetical protein AJ79_09006 [Helicocarpus griseus UAMH5409]|uniref:Uncharacterized protein n=1 Tax=Helicocarpus griseus UAMH5409 TaxID=1447875 RepID=A0A2B7WMZ4_9EURO|nr:hypothetical protein AJ79_09006 [Helicocarpus griseus UAMH5409]